MNSWDFPRLCTIFGIAACIFQVELKDDRFHLERRRVPNPITLLPE